MAEAYTQFADHYFRLHQAAVGVAETKRLQDKLIMPMIKTNTPTNPLTKLAQKMPAPQTGCEAGPAAVPRAIEGVAASPPIAR